MAGGAAGASAAAAAAAAARRRQQQEEEEMTAYEPGELAEGWEFKILRSMRSEFKDRQRLQQILHEEGQAGWALVEKFDDGRIRLKRPASAKRNDAQLPFDPYRAYYGRTENQHTLLILGWIFGIMFCVFALIGLIAALAD